MPHQEPALADLTEKESSAARCRLPFCLYIARSSTGLRGRHVVPEKAGSETSPAGLQPWGGEDGSCTRTPALAAFFSHYRAFSVPPWGRRPHHTRRRPLCARLPAPRTPPATAIATGA